MSTHSTKCAILALIAIAGAVVLLWIGPIAQDPDYHAFADSRGLFGISNFWNVVSNVPFLIAGALGLWRWPRLAYSESVGGYVVMCVGVVLVGLGSAYYHYAPTNETLLWDRLPMSVAFMALLALLLDERVLRTPRPQVLWILVVAGAATPLYWAWTESLGKGDLRPYVLVQFLPVVLMPLMLVMFRQRYLNSRLLSCALVLYVVAKLLEQFDGQMLALTGTVSGHAIKHLVAAAAVLCIFHAVPTRMSKRLPDTGSPVAHSPGNG